MKSLLRTALVLSMTAIAASGYAQTWPSKPIHFVVPFGPGGANDLVARYVAEAASRELGQPIIVDNKPGAGSALGAEIVARSAPDGYTFLAPAAGVITNAMIKKTMPYKEEDLVPVVLMALSPSVIVVPPDSPIRNLKDLVDQSRKGRGLTFSTAGTGSTPHFVAAMLQYKAGARLDAIPYKSGSEGVVAVIGKQVEATSEASPVVLPQVKGGKLRAIASTWNRRVAALQDVPTAEEQGVKDLVIGHWSGLFAPRGTSADVLEKMNAAVNKALKSPELRARLIPQGIDPQGGSREDFRKFLAAEKARLGPVAKAAQMQAD